MLPLQFEPIGYFLKHNARHQRELLAIRCMALLGGKPLPEPSYPRDPLPRIFNKPTVFQAPKLRETSWRVYLDFIPRPRKCRTREIGLNAVAPIEPCAFGDSTGHAQEHLFVAEIDVLVQSRELRLKVLFVGGLAQKHGSWNRPRELAILPGEIILEINARLASVLVQLPSCDEHRGGGRPRRYSTWIKGHVAPLSTIFRLTIEVTGRRYFGDPVQ